MTECASDIVQEISTIATIKPIATPEGFMELERMLMLRLMRVVEDQNSFITNVDLSVVKEEIEGGGRFDQEQIAIEIMPKANVSKVDIFYVNKSLEGRLPNSGYELVAIDAIRMIPDGRYFMPVGKMKNRRMDKRKIVTIDTKKERKDATLEVGHFVYNAFDGKLSCPKVRGYCAPVFRFFYSDLNDAKRVASATYSTLRDRKLSMNFNGDYADPK